MAYGPVNVPGAGAADMEQVESAIAAAIAQLRSDILSGAVKAQPIFPVLAADPESPEPGEAWLIKENAGEAPEN